MTRKERSAERDRREKERAPQRTAIRKAIANEINKSSTFMDDQSRRFLLKIIYTFKSKDGTIVNVGYNEVKNSYELSLEGFPNMVISMPLIEFSRLGYQMGLSYMDEDGSTSPAFLNKQELLKELENVRKACELVDVLNGEVLIYFPCNEIRNGYFYRKSDRLSIASEELADDSIYFLGDFVPKYLLYGAPELENLLEPEDEEAFVRGYQAALTQLDSFIFKQRRRFQKQGGLAEAVDNVKEAID